MTKWCVPFALSIILDTDYEFVLPLLKPYLGDEPISGIYLSIAIKILENNDFKCIPCGNGFSISKFKRIKGTYLVETNGHAQVIRDGWLFDNSNPLGTLNFPKTKCLKVYEIV